MSDCGGRDDKLSLLGPYVEGNQVHFHIHSPEGCMHVSMLEIDAAQFGVQVIACARHIHISKHAMENKAKAVVDDMMKKAGFKLT